MPLALGQHPPTHTHTHGARRAVVRVRACMRAVMCAHARTRCVSAHAHWLRRRVWRLRRRPHHLSAIFVCLPLYPSTVANGEVYLLREQGSTFCTACPIGARCSLARNGAPPRGGQVGKAAHHGAVVAPIAGRGRDHAAPRGPHGGPRGAPEGGRERGGGLREYHRARTRKYSLAHAHAHAQVMCPGAWKGTLKRGTTLDRALALPHGHTEFTVMLVGSAGAPVAPPLPEPDVLAEDPQVSGETQREGLDAPAEGDIIALQKTPGERGERAAGEVAVKYSHFVHGLPQRKIEDALRARRERGGALLGDCCALSLGLELGASYVSVLACLADGTLVSGLENGRLQLWRRCARVREMVHDSQGPVACMATIDGGPAGPAFATGGFGSVKLWTAEGECVQTVGAPPGATPRNMVACANTHLAIVFGQARAFDPHAFRLVPQNEEQRRRRAAAEAAQAEAQAAFDLLARSVQLVVLDQGVCVRSSFLEPLESPLRALASLSHSQLACGDARGGLHLWSVPGTDARRTVGLDLVSADPSAGVAVVCLEEVSAHHHLLAVSVEATSAGAVRGGGVSRHTVWLPRGACRGVALVDVARRQALAFLDAHADVVRCMCATPDGLVTGGGKMDATVRWWQASLWQQPLPALPAAEAAAAAQNARVEGLGLSHLNIEEDREAESAVAGEAAAEAQGTVESGLDKVSILKEATRTLKEPGYVFGLTVLPDAATGSNLYALAGARYNTVKICL